MAHRVLARVFAHPLPSNELWIIIPNSKALKHTHWRFWFWIFSFWSLWRGTAIQCQSYPDSVCTKSSSAQRQCQRVKAVLRLFALSKKKGDSRAELALGPHLFRWGATRLLLTSPHGQEQAATIINARLVSTTCLEDTTTQCHSCPASLQRGEGEFEITTVPTHALMGR